MAESSVSNIRMSDDARNIFEAWPRHIQNEFEKSIEDLQKERVYEIAVGCVHYTDGYDIRFTHIRRFIIVYCREGCDLIILEVGLRGPSGPSGGPGCGSPSLRSPELNNFVDEIMDIAETFDSDGDYMKLTFAGNIGIIARTQFERDKPHCNIGMVGHMGHGKMAITAVIPKALAESVAVKIMTGSHHIADEVKEKASEGKARGITISTVHAEYMKNMITGTAQTDGNIGAFGDTVGARVVKPVFTTSSDDQYIGNVVNAQTDVRGRAQDGRDICHQNPDPRGINKPFDAIGEYNVTTAFAIVVELGMSRSTPELGSLINWYDEDGPFDAITVINQASVLCRIGNDMPKENIHGFA